MIVLSATPTASANARFVKPRLRRATDNREGEKAIVTSAGAAYHVHVEVRSALRAPTCTFPAIVLEGRQDDPFSPQFDTTVFSYLKREGELGSDTTPGLMGDQQDVGRRTQARRVGDRCNTRE